MSLHRHMRIGLAVSNFGTALVALAIAVREEVKGAKSFPASLLIFVTTIGVDDDAPLAPKGPPTT